MDKTPLRNVNINVQGNENTNVNINQLLGKSYEYQDLLERLNEQQELFDLTPENNTEKRLKISGKINELNSLIEQFKQDVLSLAATFEKIEINTERLKRAKDFFDKGEIGEARAVLEIELEQMRDEQKHLLAKRDEFETEILPKLLNNSEEFYVLAMAAQVNFDNPNRFVEVSDYFERSIQSHATQYNLFNYALFLQEHNKFPKAQQYYEQYLRRFTPTLSSSEVAMTLNNLAVLHKNLNEYEKALKEYDEALEIYRNLAETNPQSYLPYAAGTLNNLANLHKNLKEYEKALKEYNEALEIRRQLAETNPQSYLPDVAMTLNNLANLHSDQKEYEKALKEYNEALEIGRQLAETNPQSYLPDVASTLINLAIYYLNDVPDREKSIEYALLAVCIIFPIADAVPYTQKYLQTALTVLQRWGLSEEEIAQKVNDVMSLKDE